MGPRPRCRKKSLKASCNGRTIELHAKAFLTLAAVVCLCGWSTDAQERGPSQVPAAELRSAIDRLGSIDYPVRTKAAQLVRRSAAAQAVPLLLQAAQEHADGYVRYRSLVLLTGFSDPRTVDQMIEVLDSPNDRLREVAYGYFERFPNPAVTPRLLTALDKELGEFVRPALVRALAAANDEPRVRAALVRDITRGLDHFRSTVIEALGDFRRGYAVPHLLDVAKLEGPLQDDAVLALGKIGDKRALPAIVALQRSRERALQPTVAAAICLLGVNCASHIGYLQKVLAFADDNPGYQEMVRAASFGLDAVAIQGNREALEVLFAAGVPSMDPLRAPLALSVAKVALRNTPLMLEFLAAAPDRRGALDLLAEGFDMLQEDLEEEQFYVTVRREYWNAPENAPLRALAEQLIGKLDF